MDIRVTARSVYGETKIYPLSKSARVFAEIAGTTTLTHETLRLIRSLGLTVTLDADETVRELVGS